MTTSVQLVIYPLQHTIWSDISSTLFHRLYSAKLLKKVKVLHKPADLK